MTTASPDSPHPTFVPGPDDPAILPAIVGPARLPPPPPRFMVRFVIGLSAALKRFAAMLTPAPMVLFDQMTGVINTMLLGAVGRLRIADHLAGGPLDIAELASRTHTHADTLDRCLRALVTMGVFERLPDGRFANNRLSTPLRSDQSPSFRDAADHFGSQANVLTWADVDESIRTGRSAFPRVYGRSVWKWFDEHPYEREVFARAMATITHLDAPAIARGYPFHEVQRLCDVGGGRGLMLSEILLVHPHLRGVILDAPGVIASGAALLRARGVADRVEPVAGSFFESVPAGCDAYFLKNVLHDWDDDTCVRILTNVRRAAQPGARVLLVEYEVRHETRTFGNIVDMQMLVACDDGRERSREEYARLLKRAGFTPGRVLPLAAPVSIFEGLAE